MRQVVFGVKFKILLLLSFFYIYSCFCIKSFKVNSNEKYFINVCQTDEIPAPEDLTDAELTKILVSDEPSSYRIPMSISEPRITRDKSNNPVDVCDIAINPQFLAKCQKSVLFKDFFLALIAEALSDKYNVQIKVDKSIILNNRKFIGTLVSHRVRNSDVKTVLGSYQNPSESNVQKLQELNKTGGRRAPLVQEIDTGELNSLKSKQNAPTTTPKFQLRGIVNEEQVEEIYAEFYLPKCISSNEFTLDIGEDRILLECKKHGYLFDKFVNYHLQQENSSAFFDKTNKICSIHIPVDPDQQSKTYAKYM